MMLRSLLLIVTLIVTPAVYAQKPAIAPGWKHGPDLEARFGIRSADNLFNRETIIPIVRLRGWFEFDGFDDTTHLQNIQITPYAYDNPTHSQFFFSHTQAGITDVVGIDRLSIVFRIGRTKDGDPPPPKLWRCLTFRRRGCPL
jgi:hypothetical protein